MVEALGLFDATLFVFLNSHALVVAYSRIYMGVHFPFDAAGGALLGSGIALLVAMFFKWRRFPPRSLRLLRRRIRAEQ
jgi:membrane-associated phospholipid phosphatase